MRVDMGPGGAVTAVTACHTVDARAGTAVSSELSLKSLTELCVLLRGTLSPVRLVV